MKIAFVASEVAPWCRDGGLADVVGSLPAALAAEGADVAVFAPLHRSVIRYANEHGLDLADTGVTVPALTSGEPAAGRFFVGRLEGRPPVYFLDRPRFYDRHGLYADAQRRPYDDNAERFGFLCCASLRAAGDLMGGVPDVFHGHDWQAGLLPVYLKTRHCETLADAAAVFTIHNLAYQGVFSKERLPGLRLEWSVFRLERMEFHDRVNLLKGGVAFADAVTTVSPSYAREIRTPEFGEGLDGFLRYHARGLVGIVNGVDVEAWDPLRDEALAATFHHDRLAGKGVCRAALAEEMRLPIEDGDLLVGFVGRFASYKGLDLLAEAVPSLHALGVRLVLMGAGDGELEVRFRYLAEAFSENVAVEIGYQEGLARRIHAGVDAVVVPSRSEPCGLSQLYGMRYGAVPVVRAVGGLRDTVADPGDAALARGEGGGFAFADPTTGALLEALDRAARLHRDDPAGWQRLQRAAMTRDISWRQPAKAYMALYRETVHSARG